MDFRDRGREKFRSDCLYAEAHVALLYVSADVPLARAGEAALNTHPALPPFLVPPLCQLGRDHLRESRQIWTEQ